MASTPCQWRLQEEPGSGQLKIGLTRCICMRRVSTLCSPLSPLTPLHPWQHDPPLPSNIVIDLSNHTPCKLLSPEGWEILRRNGRVWIVEHNRRVAQLDAISIPEFSRGKSKTFQGWKPHWFVAPIRQFSIRSDLWYVPVLGTFLSYERFLLRSFGGPGALV